MAQAFLSSLLASAMAATAIRSRLPFPHDDGDDPIRSYYLARRGDGRYFLQIRLGNEAAQLLGLTFLRIGLRAAAFDRPQRRLVDNLGWVQKLIEASGLE